jgi:CubicO group peptidase (beta-lactamase class C family)
MKRALIAALWAAAWPAATAPSAAEVSAAVDEIFAPFAQGRRPGCMVTVEAQGQTVVDRGYGFADLEHDVPITRSTVFEAGSVSKQFTAAAVLLLVRDGKLSLSDDIRKFLPELPDYGSAITIQRLLDHTSGLRDWGAVSELAGWPRGMRVYDQPDVLDIVSRQTALNYRPGQFYSYTNTGYTLLPMIVARISGMTFQQFTKTRLFDPLGMSATRWRDDFRRVEPQRAIAYDPAPSGWVQDMPFENTYGHGGLLTTTRDLAIWNAALTSGRLGTGVAERMAEPSHLADGQAIRYGRGLYVQTYHGEPELSHGGSTAGYRAWLGRFPRQGLSIAILCNAEDSSPTGLAYRIADLFVPPSSPLKASGGVPPAGLDGLYVDERAGMLLRIGLADGVLVAGHERLRRVGPDRWAGSAGDYIFTTAEMTLQDTVGNRMVYRRRPPASAAKVRSRDYLGAFASEEVGAIYRVKRQGGGLALQIDRRPSVTIPLEPAYADAFTAGPVLVRFHRGAGGRVDRLTIARPRIWAAAFQRQPGS